MTAYLCHGFRWKRKSIIVYVVLQDLDDAAPEWVIGKDSLRSILTSFYGLFDFLPEPLSTVKPVFNSARQTAPVRNVSASTLPTSIASSQPETSSGWPFRAWTSRSTEDNARFPTDSLRQRGRSFTLRSRKSRRSMKERVVTTQETTRLSNGLGIPSSPQAPDPILPGSAARVMSAGQSIDVRRSLNPQGDETLDQQAWSPVKLLEEFDRSAPCGTPSRPFAYVADYVTRIDLSCDIMAEIARYEQLTRPLLARRKKNDPQDTTPSWFKKLHDHLQRDEAIGWYIVVNNDEGRPWHAEHPPEVPSSFAHYSETRLESPPDTEDGISQSSFEESNKTAEREELRRQFGYQSSLDGFADDSLDDNSGQVPPFPINGETFLSTPWQSLQPDPDSRPKTSRSMRMRNFFSRPKTASDPT